MMQSVGYFPEGGWLARHFSFSGDVDSTSLYRGDSLLSSGTFCSTQDFSHGNICDSKQRVVWTEQEDKLLRELIQKYGTTKWSLVASKIRTKTNRHCRRRWQACVNAMGNKGAWTPEEDAKLIEGHKIYGNRWTEIAKMVPGRTDNAAKNRFVALKKNGGVPSMLSRKELQGSSSLGSGSESGVTGDVSVASEPHSGCSSGRKRDGEAEHATADGKKPRLHLDLNVDASTGFESDSDESALAHDDGSKGTCSSSPNRLMLDLNVPCDSSDY